MSPGAVEYEWAASIDPVSTEFRAVLDTCTERALTTVPKRVPRRLSTD